jgi:hypothetical protein
MATCTNSEQLSTTTATLLGQWSSVHTNTPDAPPTYTKYECVGAFSDAVEQVAVDLIPTCTQTYDAVVTVPLTYLGQWSSVHTQTPTVGTEYDCFAAFTDAVDHSAIGAIPTCTNTYDGVVSVALNTGVCTSPVYTATTAHDEYNFDGGNEYWWGQADAWSGNHLGPQTTKFCSTSSMSTTDAETEGAGDVKSYPHIDYEVTGRNNWYSSPWTGPTKALSDYTTMQSTFSENFTHPSGDSWDAGYDLWTNASGDHSAYNFNHEVMVWNAYDGPDAAYWDGQKTATATLGGVAYDFVQITGCGTPCAGHPDEDVFIRQTQASSGSVDIKAAYNWLTTHHLDGTSCSSSCILSTTDVPWSLQYGVEITGTPSSGNETFPVTGLTYNLS